ncbi:uncharacterized protein N7484_009790 [Penicillium longicatenatum]|uniref:uncharacterized protein n=1 Tax=Penicillium longicatenatum TaxID=1561947 RepID=UPI0025466759|nr:uncharacterized protein N7484_009790 [Penicillium longicatenatum]KAJ5636477.1 hypothetical protein N7484_009790 [Penicillium longicatenatum]
MRFTIATVAFFAGLAAAMPNGADTTVYETDEVTITSCGPTVTNCPANSGVPTSAPAVVTSVPQGAGAGSSPAPSSGAPAPSAPAASGPAPSAAPSWTTSVPAVAPVPSVPAGNGGAGASSMSYSVVAHTTCVPTVIYSTVPIPMGTSPVTAGSGGSAPHAPSATALLPPALPLPPPSATPAYSGAGAVSGSIGFAGLAAVAAFVLA